MSRFLAAFTLLLSCTAFTTPTGVAVELRDDRGALVRLASPAQRIVALAPNLTEIAFAAGAGERLVGVARLSDFPAAARYLPRVGDAARVDLERILSLNPDLILAWKSGNQPGDIARLEQFGLHVFVTEPQRLPDIPRLLRSVGALASTLEAAEAAATAFEREIEALRAQYGARPPVRVFYEIWHEPLLTVNGRHMISDVITLCGGVNVFADASLLTPSVSLEAVLAARPEAMLGGGSATTAEEFVAQWHSSSVEGLKHIPVFYIDPDEIQRQTPRIVLGAKAICAALEKVRANRQPR